MGTRTVWLRAPELFETEVALSAVDSSIAPLLTSSYPSGPCLRSAGVCRPSHMAGAFGEKRRSGRNSRYRVNPETSNLLGRIVRMPC